MSSKKNLPKDPAVKEFKIFLEQYLLPLIGIPSYKTDLVLISPSTPATAGRYVRQENNTIYFSSYTEDLFSMVWLPSLSQDDISLSNNVIHAFFDVSEYSISDKKQPRRNIYKSNVIREENYRMAVQKGVCDWCAGRGNESFYRLIHILEKWSVQTYEGNKVTFGFIYDPSAVPADNFSFSNKKEFGSGDSWLDFLQDDYAATLTDCIHSVIRLDKHCNFVEFLSVTDKNRVEEFALSASPIQICSYYSKTCLWDLRWCFFVKQRRYFNFKTARCSFNKEKYEMVEFRL